jgi:hypothetical protein
MTQFNYAKNDPKEKHCLKQSLKRMIHDSISVSILIFRWGYDTLSRDSIVGMLDQIFTKKRI